MSSGTFKDQEKENLANKLKRQKRIVFGERPTEITAQTLRSAARFNDMPEKSQNVN